MAATKPPKEQPEDPPVDPENLVEDPEDGDDEKRVRAIVRDEVKSALTEFFEESKPQNPPKGAGKGKGVLSVFFGEATG